MVDQNIKTTYASLWERHIKRPGNEELFGWLEKSDFFTAPASAKYHLNEVGGLCRHSINVRNRLFKLLYEEYPDDCPYTPETIAIVSLLHDICKVGCYKTEWKNQKTYDPEKVQSAQGWQIKKDNAGMFIWETVPQYKFEEDFTFGHGEKSVFRIMQFMKLTDEEAQAIRFHMGPWNCEEKQDAGKAFEKNPLAFFLHFADSAATFLDEVR